MNITLNGTQLFGNCPSSSNPTTENIGKTFVYCIICVVSLVGNTLIGIIVCKTRTMRKPINSLIVNMAISDMLFPLFGFPWILTELFVDSWLISGSLGQATCKLLPFLQGISPTVSIQSLVLIAADRFGAVVFPLSYRVRSSKLYLILATWMIAIAIQFPYILAFKVVKYPDRLVCRPMWSLWSVFQKPLLCGVFYCIHFHPISVDIHTLHYHLSKIQVAEDSRWTVTGQSWATTRAKRKKCVKDGHCYSHRICNMLATDHRQ